ncbi:MAG: PTS system mannose/fructose/sorbose family transporter subunit IID [Calditrichia bacterium]|nr:PTS system mannose/fructose/sorbose family transporter subunit IID [Calditrichia bacterium]
MQDNNQLSFTEHFNLFFRSFFVQALWNYRSMLSLGLCFVLLPVRKKIDKSSYNYKHFVEDNIKFFNAHPYFTGYIIGLLYKIYVDNPDEIHKRIEKLKSLLISPLGSIGDKLFWENIKPAMMLLAVFGALLQILEYSGWIIMLAAFIGYNVPHFYIRWNGIKLGFNMGFQIYHKLNFESFEKMYKLYLNIGKVMWVLGFGLTIIIAWKSFNLVIIPVFLINFLLTVFIYHYTNSVFRYLGMLLIINIALIQIFMG